MTRRHLDADLTPEAAHYLERVRSLRPPVDLVEHVMVAVEATPQERLDLGAVPRPVLFGGIAAVAAALLAAAVLLRQAPPNVTQPGPETTPTPVTSAQSSLDQLPTAGEVVNRIPVDFYRVPRFFAHGYLWMEDESESGGRLASGELVRVDPATGAMDSLDVTGRIGIELNATADETSVWAFDGFTKELVQIDPETLTEVRRIRANPQGFAMARGTPWFVDRNELVWLDLATGAEEWRVPLPAQASQHFLLDGDTLWVGRADGAVTRLDAATGAVEDEIVTGVVAFDIFDAGDAILVYGGITGLARVDKRTGAVTLAYKHEAGDEIPADDLGKAPASADGRVWATTAGSGHLVELDPTTLQPIAALQLGLTGFQGQLVPGGDALWVVGIDSADDRYLVQISPTP